MTVNGRHALCCRKDASLGAHHKTWMKIDPYYQRQKCRPLTLVSGDIRLTRYSRRFPGEGASNDSGVVDNGNFHLFRGIHLRKHQRWGPRYYTAIRSLSSAFHWSQKVWPWMTLTGYFTLNSVFAPVCLSHTARISKNNCVKTSKERHILSAAQISGMDSIFWQYKVCVDIRSGSLERRG